MSKIMTTRDNSTPPKHALRSRTGSWWRQLLFLGIIGLGLFVLFGSRDKPHPPADKPLNTVAQQAPAAAPPSGSAWTASSDGLVVTSGQPSAPSQTPVAPSQTPVVQARNSVVEDLVAPFKNMQELTPEGAKDLKRRLQDMRERGTAVVPAIRDFLRSQQDVEFDKMPGGKLAEQRTLRLALIDTLRQIGGAEAVDVSLDQLRMTKTPSEVAMLALNLEEAAPGVYRDEAIGTVLGALQDLARTKNPLEVRPLFEALQALGGLEATTALEQFPHNADMVGYLSNKDTKISPTVGTYALITLANLPDGEGISSLADLAGDPNVPVAHRTTGPFQMLAQASADHAQAAEELVALAEAKQIPDQAWDAVANALAGKELQFPTPPPEGTPPGKNEAGGSGAGASFVRGFYDDERNLLYEERLLSPTWSATQVQQQLALIDVLLGMTDAPAATKALQRARDTLTRRRS